MATIQAKLREGYPLEKLTEEFAIYVRSHSEYPHLKLFKYDQIKSPFKEKIAQEARGVILDENDNWNIVAYPYDKFFNLGESLAASVDLESLQVATKEDGSLMTLYYYDSQWHISSSGSPHAGGSTNGLLTFKELFWKVWNDLEYQLPSETDMCFMFELCTAENRVVVDHFESRIVLHGARHLKTLEEYHPQPLAEKYKWEGVKYHNLKDFQEIVVFAEEFSPTANEGFIAMDKDFNRVKIKSRKYVEFHHMKTGQRHDDISILKIIQMNESEEYLAYFPRYKDKHDELLERYKSAIKRVEDLYENVDCDCIKTFAISIKDEPLKSILFSRKRQNISILDGFTSIDPKHLINKI